MKMNKSDEYTEKELKKIEKKIKKIFARAEKEVTEKALKYLEEFKKEDNDMLYKFQNKLITQNEYYSWRQSKITTGKRYNKLLSQIDRELIKAGYTSFELINGKIPQIFMANYNSVHEYVNDTMGYSFNLINKDVFAQMIERKEVMLPPPREINSKKMSKWNVNHVNSEVLQGVLQGESISDISKRLSKVCASNQYVANRNARTMVTAAQNSGRIQGMSRLTGDGVILKKIWISAHDKRVRDSHIALDGAECDNDEPFDNGLMFPGDWNGAPEEVYNCRCTLGVRVVGFRRL